MKRFAFKPYLLIVWALILTIASAAAVEEMGIILLAMGTPFVLLISFLWPARWKNRHWLLRNAIAVPLALALIVSVVWTEWPLRLNYALVKSAMNSVAANVEKGRKIETPFQVGTFRISKIETRNGVVCLWTDPDPGGPTGFVKTSPSKVSSQFNLWSTLKLDNDWQFISED